MKLPFEDTFTDRARQVIRFARQYAGNYGCKSIDTGHLLVALTLEESGVAANVLRNFGITTAFLFKGVKLDNSLPVSPPKNYTAWFTTAIEHARAHANKWGHKYIGTEHLLAGLLGIGTQTSAFTALASQNVNIAQIQMALNALFTKTRTDAKYCSCGYAMQETKHGWFCTKCYKFQCKACAEAAKRIGLLQETLEKADNTILSLHNAVDWIKQHVEPVLTRLRADRNCFNSFIQNRFFLELKKDMDDAQADEKEYSEACDKLKKGEP